MTTFTQTLAQMIKVKASISFKQYLRLLFALTYRKPMMKVILAVALIMLAWILGYYLHLFPLPRPSIYQFTTLGLICIVQPLAIFLTIWKNYHSSNQLKEPVEMEFTNEELRLKGQSFNTQLTWDKMYKLEEVGDWYLVYQNSLSAVLIPKKSFTVEKDKAFRLLLQSVAGVPLHLKEPQY